VLQTTNDGYRHRFIHFIAGDYAYPGFPLFGM